MKRFIAPGFLLAIGLSAIFFELVGAPTLKGLAMGTLLAPAPKVFSTVQGLETFSTAFTIETTNKSGEKLKFVVDKKLYGRFEGPYNRRNAYGALLAYGPVLASSETTKPMLESAAHYAFCTPGTLVDELGLDRFDSYTVRFHTRVGSELGELPTFVEIKCVETR